MAVYKGLYHCTECGSILGSRIVKLGNSCIVPPSVAGKRNLDCISKDKFPQGVSEWPSDHPALPRYNPRPAGQLIAYHLQPASTPILERAQQFSASAAAEAALNRVATKSRQVASLDMPASSSSSSGTTNPLPPSKLDIIEDDSSSD